MTIAGWLDAAIFEPQHWIAPLTKKPFAPAGSLPEDAIRLSEAEAQPGLTEQFGVARP